MTEDRNTAEGESAEAQAQAPAPVTRPRGVWLARLAVLLALLALAGAGGAGLFAWQQRLASMQLEGRLAALEQALNEQRSALDALNALPGEIDTLRQRLAAQQQGVQETAGRIEAMRAELEGLRAGLREERQASEALRALLGGDERLWRLGEIERLLSAAQIRLQLLDDAPTARLLLQQADRIAAALGSEALPLRDALQQAIIGAQAPRLDREGLALRLTRLAETLPSLPRASPEPQPGGQPPAQGWWAKARAWMGDWLHIERKAAPAGEDPSLQQASAQLIEARHALLARDTEQALALLREAARRAEGRLDARDGAVRAAQEELAALIAELERPAPTKVDLTPAFAALRALREARPGPAAILGTNQGE